MTSEPTSAAPSPRDRPSVVDVFENFLGEDLGTASARHIEALSQTQADELVEHLDRFLLAASSDEFAEGAVTLDGFASPIIVPYDRAELRTTRRAKQVALAYREVVFPLQEVALDYERHGRVHLASLCSWTWRNEELLRPHVFTLVRTPELLDVFGVEDVCSVAEWLLETLTSPPHRGVLQSLIPEWRTLDSISLTTRLNEIIYSTLQDAIAGGAHGTGLSFTRETAGRFFDFCASVAGDASDILPEVLCHVTLLHNLELPAIDDLADEDFAGLRLDSEGFSTFRDVLTRALRETSAGVVRGLATDQAFRGSLAEVRWQAELLRRDIRTKAGAAYFRPAAQAVVLSALTSTAATAAATSTPLDWTSLTARFGTSVALSGLVALLTYRAPSRQTRLLRFYDVLLDER